MSEHTTGPTTTTPAHGVEELITRIRDVGVSAAREEAERIVTAAKEKAARLTADARAEIAELHQKARAQIETDRSAAIESLQMAARDTALELRSQVVSAFERSLRRLVTMELKDEELLKTMILAIAGRAGDRIGDEEVEVLLADELFRGHEERTEASEHLRSLVHGLTAATLRDGVELVPSSDVKAGARVRLVGQHVEFDMTDEALSELFLSHLLPRFAAMLRGAD